MKLLGQGLALYGLCAIPGTYQPRGYQFRLSLPRILRDLEKEALLKSSSLEEFSNKVDRFPCFDCLLFPSLAGPVNSFLNED